MSTPAQRMVAEQLLPNGVTDQRVIDAMSQVPREEFLSGRLRRHAYENRALAIDCGQTISQPLVVALMTQAAAPKPEDRALEVGTGSGYQAAVLSRLVRSLITLELEPSLAERASETLSRLGFSNVEVAVSDGSLGWPLYAPYDIILVAAASPETASTWPRAYLWPSMRGTGKAAPQKSGSFSKICGPISSSTWLSMSISATPSP